MHCAREGEYALRRRKVPRDPKVLPRLPQQAPLGLHAQGLLPCKHLPTVRSRVPLGAQGRLAAP